MTPCRETALMVYGRQCVCCGERRLALLELDHANGGGNLHRRQLYPISLEKRLEDLGYPNEVDGHIIQIRCKRCHLSKTKHGSCQIDHSEDVMDEEREEVEEDTSLRDSRIPTKLVRDQKRAQAKALMQLSTRVEPHIKQWLDELSENQGISVGGVLSQLKTKVEQGEVSRHLEQMKILREIQAELQSLKQSSVLQELTVIPDPFPHRNPKNWTEESAPIVEIIPARPSWLQKIFGVKL